MPRRTRPTNVLPIALRELEVLRVAEVTPGMRRVTLTGVQLEAHTTQHGVSQREFVSLGFDDDVRLVFPHPGATDPVLPIVKDGGLIHPKESKVLSRVYTVRRYDPKTLELDIDFVTHGIGIATTWAHRARVGDRIHVLGPSRVRRLPEGFDWLLVVGDDTAIPAIARLMEELPDETRAQVFIEVAEDAHQQDLRGLPHVTVTWLPRNGAAPGTTGLLVDAVRGTSWWDGSVFAWLAGEQANVRDLRRHLVEDRGLDKTTIDFAGYWKRHDVVALTSDAAVPDLERNEEAYEKLHRMTELLPPLAVRTAVTLGIADQIARGVNTVPALAEATATDARALDKFLRYLTAIALIEPAEGGTYRLTDAGEFLTADYVIDVLHRDGVQSRREFAFHGLEQTIRTGRSAYAAVTGREYAGLRTDPEYEHKLLEETAGYADFFITPIADAEALAGAKHVVVHSDGAGAFAGALVSAQPDVRVTIPALPTAAAWLRDELRRSIPDAAAQSRVRVIEQSLFERTPESDIVVIVNVLAEHPDAEAALILRRAAESVSPTGKLLLAETTFDTDQLDEHDAEHDLLNLALHGSGHRTTDELAAVIADAALTIAATENIGWRIMLYTLTTSHQSATQ